MRQLCRIGLLGLGLVGLVIVTVGGRFTVNAQQSPAVLPTSVLAGAFGARSDEPPPPPVKIKVTPPTLIETKIGQKLQARLPFSFPESTPIEEVMKYVQSSTIDKADFPDGIPIYLDPVGFQDADKTAKSTISIDLKGIPLATSLRLVLKQLGLDFWIHPDGLLIVTSAENEDIPVEPNGLILQELSALRHEVKALRDEIRARRGMESVPQPAQPGSLGTPSARNPGGMM